VQRDTVADKPVHGGGDLGYLWSARRGEGGAGAGSVPLRGGQWGADIRHRAVCAILDPDKAMASSMSSPAG